jgi:hypothetical protein
MKGLLLKLMTLCPGVFACDSAFPADAPVHVWEKQELTFAASRDYANPYTDVVVWVDLAGPDFKKRVYGFWDGGKTFRVRLVATQPGKWSWSSGSAPADPGLAGKTGAFTAVSWTDKEKAENPVRRGFIRPTPNNHALQYADGTPFFVLGDTWYSVGTNRFRWYDDDRERPVGPAAGFKDYVRFRKAQGFNWVNVIAAFPNWKTDDKPWNFTMNDSARTTIRSAWLEFGTGSAKNMDNEGGRPFLFPGKVPGYEDYFPDVDRINPEYFEYLDRKIDYLSANGIVPFIEASRRDASLLWSKYYRWPDSYARYIEYIWSRYQANNTVLSPVHLDIISETIGPDEFTKAIRMVVEKYGPPPFGTLLSANANPSTLENWGDNSWVTLHQTGNAREHYAYWYLTEIYHATPARPAINGEPYYSGYTDARSLGGGRGYQYGAAGGTPKDDQFVRSAMYGNFLSGALGGYVYGAEGIWGADIEDAAPTKMWDAFKWNSAAQLRYLRDFAFSIGKQYQELEPIADLIVPHQTSVVRGYEGWAYCARTPDRKIFLAYFEKDCPRSQVRGARLNSSYRAQWFDPRDGSWRDTANGTLRSNATGVINLPDFPDGSDWGLRLILEEPRSQQNLLSAAQDLRPKNYKGTALKDSRYSGVQAIPGRVQCEAYDRGGEGVAYHDTDAKNNGSGNLNPPDGSYLNEFRKDEGVDISYTKFRDQTDNNPYNRVAPEPDQLYVGWTEPGEWINLTVNVQTEGDYSLNIMYTSNRGGSIRLDLNGQKLVEPVEIPSTYDASDPLAWRQWHHWNKLIHAATVHLPEGLSVLTLRILTLGNMNFDYLEFTIP